MNTFINNTRTFGSVHIANPTIRRRILKKFVEEQDSGFAKTYADNFTKAEQSRTYDVIVDKYGDVYIKNKNNKEKTLMKGFSSTFANLNNALKTVIMLDELYGSGVIQ